MAVTKCERGHFFDNAKFSSCPHCENHLPASPRRAVGEGLTMFGAALSFDAPREKVRVEMAAPRAAQDEKTVGIFRTEKGYDPVVGWLVSVRGREMGRDFRLHAGRNEIGRAMKSDIALVDDERVSRSNHCSVIFDPRRCGFHLVRGDSGDVFVNGRGLGEGVALQEGDEIEIGGSVFVFVPFCREGRTW